MVLHVYMQGLEKLVHLPKITQYVTELNLSLLGYLLALITCCTQSAENFFLSILSKYKGAEGTR